MIKRRLFIQITTLTIFLTIISFLPVFSQEELPIPSEELPPLESFIRELDFTIKSATSQEDLAKRVFNVFQEIEYNTGIPISNRVFIPPSPYLENLPEFKSIFDLMENKWLSFPKDEYYDENGLFLVYGNIAAGRFDKAEAIYEKILKDLPGRGIDPYFYRYTIINIIDKMAFYKESYASREDLSLAYVVRIIQEVYNSKKLNRDQNKILALVELLASNYNGTKAGEFFLATAEFNKAMIKYGSPEAIPSKERKQLSNNIWAALDGMKKDWKEENK